MDKHTIIFYGKLFMNVTKDNKR